MKQSNKIKTPLVFKFGLVLLCVMLISTSMMGDLYARYATTVTASDSVRVASFDVSADIAENADGNYVLTITNNSEVTVKYRVDSSSILADGISIKLDGNSQGDGKTLAIGASITHVVTISETYSAKHEDLEIDLIVYLEQVD